jgi:hypothetical protein
VGRSFPQVDTKKLITFSFKGTHPDNFVEKNDQITSLAWISILNRPAGEIAGAQNRFACRKSDLKA